MYIPKNSLVNEVLKDMFRNLFYFMSFINILKDHFKNCVGSISIGRSLRINKFKTINKQISRLYIFKNFDILFIHTHIGCSSVRLFLTHILISNLYLPAVSDIRVLITTYDEQIWVKKCS